MLGVCFIIHEFWIIVLMSVSCLESVQLYDMKIIRSFDHVLETPSCLFELDQYHTVSYSIIQYHNIVS